MASNGTAGAGGRTSVHPFVEEFDNWSGDESSGDQQSSAMDPSPQERTAKPAAAAVSPAPAPAAAAAAAATAVPVTTARAVQTAPAEDAAVVVSSSAPDELGYVLTQDDTAVTKYLTDEALRLAQCLPRPQGATTAKADGDAYQAYHQKRANGALMGFQDQEKALGVGKARLTVYEHDGDWRGWQIFKDGGLAVGSVSVRPPPAAVALRHRDHAGGWLPEAKRLATLAFLCNVEMYLFWFEALCHLELRDCEACR